MALVLLLFGLEQGTSVFQCVQAEPGRPVIHFNALPISTPVPLPTAIGILLNLVLTLITNNPNLHLVQSNSNLPNGNEKMAHAGI